jgi:hypothetical protein
VAVASSARRALPLLRTVTAARRLLAIVAAGIVAACFLPASVSAAELPPAPEGEALIEVFLVETGWTPAQGWPPDEYPSPYTLPAIHWTEIEAKGEVPLTGGRHEPELSVERLVQLAGLPLERLSGLATRNHNKEQVFLSRPELIGVSANETAYVEAERVHGKPTLSLVVPPGATHPARIEAGVGHSLRVVLVEGGSILELAPIQFRPSEPNAGTAVDFARPGIEGGADPLLNYSYHWSFGDGATSSDMSPRHVFPSASENGTSEYEVSVEVVASRPNGVEIASATRSTSVPVLTTGAKPPSQEPSQLGVKRPTVHNGPRNGGHPGASVPHHSGLGGTGGKGQGGTAGHGLGIGGRAGPGEGNPNQRGIPNATHPSSTHGHARQPTPTPVPSHAQGRAPKPIEKPAPTVPRPQPGLTGVLLESLGGTPPAAMVLGGSTPSPTAVPLHALSPHPQASVSTLGALGLVAGILVVLLFILWGAVSEMRVGWFVR